MTKFKYPCTGRIRSDGFSAFLDGHMGNSRRNLALFTQELGGRFDAKYLTLVNSGSSANLVAALAFAEMLKEQNRPLTAVASAYSFPTTISSLLMAGFSVRLIDTEENGFNLCPHALEKELEENPASLICLTHFLGFPAQMGKIFAAAKKHKALIL